MDNFIFISFLFTIQATLFIYLFIQFVQLIFVILFIYLFIVIVEKSQMSEIMYISNL